MDNGGAVGTAPARSAAPAIFYLVEQFQASRASRHGPDRDHSAELDSLFGRIISLAPVTQSEGVVIC
jgi:hypothetical protein